MTFRQMTPKQMDRYAADLAERKSSMQVQVKSYYVAAPSAFWREARAYMQKLRLAGNIVTFDWTYPVESLGQTPEDPCLQREHAEADRKGILSADEVHILAYGGGTGCWIEMGMALALRIPVKVFGPERHRPGVFCALVTDGGPNP